jgi:quercetin dioxygenase-like cupin family protein
MSPTPLVQPDYVGIGRYQELATITTRPSFGGVPFASFVEVRQTPGTTLPTEDVPGFVYGYQGQVVVSREGTDIERQQVVDQGTAKWVPYGSAYTSPSTGAASWYFIAVRSILSRTAPQPYPESHLLYASDDFPAPPSDKQLVFTLGYITMDVDGRTSSHSHGGTEIFYVLKGTVFLATNDGRRINLAAGQGATIKPGVVMQLRVVGDQPVQILSLFVTPEGAPWQTNLQQLP